MAGSRFLRRTLIVIGALAISGIGAFLGWNAWTIRELDRAKALFSSAGLPMRIAEITPPAVPDAENAAPLIAKIADITARADYGGIESAEGIAEKLKRFKLRTGSLGIDAISLQQAREILALPPVIEILTVARNAADLPGFDEKLDFSAGTKLTTPHYSPLRTAADILRIQIRISISARAKDEAARDIWRLLNLADFVATEPTCLSQLIRITLIEGALDELSYAVAADALTETWALRFSERLAKIDIKAGMLNAFDGERLAFGAPLFEDMISGKVNAADAFSQFEGGRKNPLLHIPKGWMRLEYASYLHHFHRYRSISETDWTQPIEQHRQMSEVSTSIPRYRFFVLVALPSLAGVTSKAVENQTRTIAAQAGLAAHRYRLHHGHFPTSLTELVPGFLSAIPTDNHSGAPMIYRREQAAFLLYGVGKNGRDDGGRSTSPRKEDDLGFSPALLLPEPVAR